MKLRVSIQVLAPWVIGSMIVIFAAMQVVPYGHDHTNPPVVREPAWSSLETRAFAVRACYDCHSNQTAWPWYSSVAPMSWLIQRDVVDGRGQLNFSDWGHSDSKAGDAIDQVRSGTMPPWYYVILHPNARLTSAEMQAFPNGLTGTH